MTTSTASGYLNGYNETIGILDQTVELVPDCLLFNNDHSESLAHGEHPEKSLGI